MLQRLLVLLLALAWARRKPEEGKSGGAGHDGTDIAAAVVGVEAEI
jgi:hypothetical protein